MFSLSPPHQDLPEGAAAGDQPQNLNLDLGLEGFFFLGPWCLQVLVPPGGACDAIISSKEIRSPMSGQEKTSLLEIYTHSL